MPERPIVIVGSLNLDLVLRVDRLPRPGETIHGLSLAHLPGGKGANQGVAAARLGAPVAMIGRLGKDAAANLLRQSLRNNHIDDDAVEATPDTPTGTAIIHIDSAGQNSITLLPGANAHLTPADIDRHAGLLRRAAIVLLQLEIPLATIQHTVSLCAAAGVPIMLDPAPAQPLPAALLRQITYLTPNETEAAILCAPTHPADIPHIAAPSHPEDSARTEIPTRPGKAAQPAPTPAVVPSTDMEHRQAAHLHTLGAQTVILKLGARGAFFSRANRQGNQPPEAFLLPSHPVQATDTTAAGDCFNAALAVALRRGDPPRIALRFANAAAALSTTRPGAQPSLPTLAEVEAFMLNAEKAQANPI